MKAEVCNGSSVYFLGTVDKSKCNELGCRRLHQCFNRCCKSISSFGVRLSYVKRSFEASLSVVC